MKPSGILLFFLAIFVLLLAVAFCFPDEGIRLSDNITLRFVNSKDIFPGEEEKYADIRQILASQQILNDTLLTELADQKSIPEDTIRANRDSLMKSITQIEFPHDDPALLYPFFRALKALPGSGELIRILHYGDSQIEDDRITSLLRSKLQGRFGGSGAGLVPASQLYPYSFSMKQENSENWYRYIIFGKRDTTIKHNHFGALASYSSFIPYQNRTTRDTTMVEAWIRFSKSPYSYNNTRKFSQCRIFYGYNTRPFINEVYQDGQLVDAEILPASNRLRVVRWTFDDPPDEVMLKFKGQSSPEFYGIALDDLSGIAVDNIPLRGCSGLFFTRIDEPMLAQMYKELNVKLFILQFGGNFVPANLENFHGYENWFTSQLIRIKRACPGAAILVIGVADMSVKEKNRYVTSPNVEKVRDALKNAAFRSGAAFWDMYRAMGGRNSMPAWVFAEPPLASGDFVHFNPRGAKTIAQMFYNSLIFEYHRFEKNAN
jgi:hypothetical protein